MAWRNWLPALAVMVATGAAFAAGYIVRDVRQQPAVAPQSDPQCEAVATRRYSAWIVLNRTSPERISTVSGFRNKEHAEQYAAKARDDWDCKVELCEVVLYLPPIEPPYRYWVQGIRVNLYRNDGPFDTREDARLFAEALYGHNEAWDIVASQAESIPPK